MTHLHRRSLEYEHRDVDVNKSKSSRPTTRVDVNKAAAMTAVEQ
jgi:hypothetical protein